MRGARLAAVLAMLAAPAAVPAGAQQVDWATLGEALHDQRPDGPEMASGESARLRGLDKISGAIEEITLPVGDTVMFHRLSITLTACRYPAEDPEADAFAFLQITDTTHDDLAFRGWMVASSPALNALDHPRYDVWVLGCD